jgi:phosphatidylglycerophosphate synthase
MSKLALQNKFLDLSDYGRSLGTLFARQLTDTRFTPIHVTLLFGISGLLAIFCILNGYYVLAGAFLILKSIIDAADGELARLKQTPSYTGRYLDSVFDIILNLFILMSICFVSDTHWGFTFLAFLGIQLQGTLYNYYYVILRNNLKGGDTTSKIFETKTPIAFPGEKQKWVNVLFMAYYICYGIFDKIIYLLDTDAHKVKTLPSWFMTLVSVYGLGFQLLIIAIMLPLGYINSIVPLFVYSSVFILVLVSIRKVFFPIEKP